MILSMKSLFFALLAIASFSADSFGQTIIGSLPYTITAPGTYVLDSNLVYSSAAGAAITILSSNVTLDLGGHYIYYPGTPTSNVDGTSIGLNRHGQSNRARERRARGADQAD